MPSRGSPKRRWSPATASACFATRRRTIRHGSTPSTRPVTGSTSRATSSTRTTSAASSRSGSPRAHAPGSRSGSSTTGRERTSRQEVSDGGSPERRGTALDRARHAAGARRTSARGRGATPGAPRSGRAGNGKREAPVAAGRARRARRDRVDARPSRRRARRRRAPSAAGARADPSACAGRTRRREGRRRDVPASQPAAVTPRAPRRAACGRTPGRRHRVLEREDGDRGGDHGDDEVLHRPPSFRLDRRRSSHRSDLGSASPA